MNVIPSAAPQNWLEGCIAAHRRLDAVVTSLSDEMARRPSLLAEWTVGHLLTHLARNADSHTGMVVAAQRGEVGPQYPGGPAQRAADIAAGQGRPAVELASDVRMANERLEQAWAATGEEVWARGVGRPKSGPKTIAELVFRRWREVEIHLIDLGLVELGSPDWDGLSAAYVDAEWDETLARLPDRVPDRLTLVLVPGDRPSRAYGHGAELEMVQASPGRILGWLFVRGGDPAWPALRPWE